MLRQRHDLYQRVAGMFYLALDIVVQPLRGDRPTFCSDQLVHEEIFGAVEDLTCARQRHHRW